MNDPGSSRSVRPVASGSGQRVDAKALLEALQTLRHVPCDAEFWALYCLCAAQLCRASAALALARSEAGWTVLGDSQSQSSGLDERWPAVVNDLFDRLGDKGFGVAPAGLGTPAIAVGVRLAGEREAMLLLEVPEPERPRLNELVLRAQLIADIPDSAAHSSAAGPPMPSHGDAVAHAAPSAAALLAWLELVVRVTRERSFGAASLALVNGIAAQTGWTQVVLGWRQASYVRARAISHLDRFERRADHVRLLESAMEETLDHDAVVRDPALSQTEPELPAIAHARLRQGLGLSHLVSLPLRDEDESAEAVLLLASDDAEPPELALESMQLAVQLSMPWLSDLEEQDRWFGARWARTASRWAAETVRLQNLGQKMLAILVAGVLLYGLFGTWPHRVDATAELVTDSAQLLNSPFDGYMDQVLVTAGDTVRQGSVMAVLDRQELLLQESEIRAEIRRYGAESEKARAAGQSADVQIALARRAQSQARLERVVYQLEQARILAPFDGVVVEGERREMLGAAIRRGDKLFRVARVEGLYVTLYVPEAEMRFIAADASGQISLLSQPDRNYPIRIEAVIPMAQVKPQTGNLFMVRARLLNPPEEWWRPGMTGLARIDAGDRNILWLLSRRAVDAIRMKLWW